VIVSDDDDDNDAKEPQKSNIVSIKLPKRILELNNPVNEDELNQKPSPKVDLKHGSLRTNAAHEKDLQHLQQQLAAAKAKIKEVQHDAEWKVASLIRQQDIAINKQRADLEEALEAERAESSDLNWECAQLRRELEVARSCLKGESNLIRKRDEYERL
jgi:chromosome segregation ATPase